MAYYLLFVIITNFLLWYCGTGKLPSNRCIINNTLWYACTVPLREQNASHLLNYRAHQRTNDTKTTSRRAVILLYIVPCTLTHEYTPPYETSTRFNVFEPPTEYT